MSDKHTPGPWRAREGVIEGDWFISCPVGPGNTGYVAKTAATNERAKEDAHLIAAAPDLLEALEVTMQYGLALIEMQAGDKWMLQAIAADVEKARAAIAKARGK